MKTVTTSTMNAPARMQALREPGHSTLGRRLEMAVTQRPLPQPWRQLDGIVDLAIERAELACGDPSVDEHLEQGRLVRVIRAQVAAADEDVRNVFRCKQALVGGERGEALLVLALGE